MAQNERDIVTTATDLARRVNIHTMSRLVSVSILWGTAIAMMLVVISKFVSIPLTFAVSAVLCAGLLMGLIRGILARVSDLEAAMMADTRLDLKERLSSAIELLGTENRREMAELQLEDAAEYARSLDRKAVCPRMFPIAAKILPVALAALVIFMYILSPYGQAAQVPADVRQAIQQAGAEMETAAREMDREALSDKVAELTSKMEKIGRELRDKPLTKKEALKNLSKLARKVEALKVIGEITENLEGDMTPDRKRVLKDLLEKLADSLKDIPEMAEFSREVLETQQENLSPESLKALADALEQMGIKASDMEVLQKMMEQLAKEKRDVGQTMVRSPESMGDNEPSDLKAEEESGLMGSGSPGKKAAKDMKEEIESASHRPIPSDQGYDSELEGQLSETGRSVSTDDDSEPEVGESSVPYQEIYVKYRDAADDAIARPEIPWMYKEHVKNYFDAIKPKAE